MGQYYMTENDNCKFAIKSENVGSVTHIMGDMNWAEIASCKRFMCPRAVIDSDPDYNLVSMFAALGFKGHMLDDGSFELDYLDTYGSYSFEQLLDDVFEDIAFYVEDGSLIVADTESGDDIVWRFSDGSVSFE